MVTPNSIWVAHPTGNTFVRALLAGLEACKADYKFLTTIGFSTKDIKSLPGFMRKELGRRSYEIPRSRLISSPLREMGRLATQRFNTGNRSNPLFKPISVDAIYGQVDKLVCARLDKAVSLPTAVYMYEDGAADTFQHLQGLPVKRVYELPIAYYKLAHRLLDEEGERLPAWRGTLGTPDDPILKLQRKDRELDMADLVVVPSQFVHDSLPESIRKSKPCIVSAFGSPEAVPPRVTVRDAKLRVLFAGNMTQRKGLADVFAAMNLLKNRDVELVVMGSPSMPLEFYQKQCSFTFEPPRNHHAFLQMMASCDILVLPSIVEGRALVQQEALACGLPIIVTRNAGGEDLVDEARTGFLIPIRSPEKIAAKIAWFADNRSTLDSMRPQCIAKAAEYSWERYARRIIEAIFP